MVDVAKIQKVLNEHLYLNAICYYIMQYKTTNLLSFYIALSYIYLFELSLYHTSSTRLRTFHRGFTN